MNEYIGELFSALAYPTFAGVVATEGDRREVESLPLTTFGDFVRGQISAFEPREIHVRGDMIIQTMNFKKLTRGLSLFYEVG
jgi:hypothetical protein